VTHLRSSVVLKEVKSATGLPIRPTTVEGTSGTAAKRRGRSA
jgi:hypothetical protein